MKAYVVFPQYQAPGGPSSSPNNVVSAIGKAIRIEPIPNNTGGGVSFPPNRHVFLDGSAQVNVSFSGSSWFPGDFSSFQFGIETAGVAASDAWLVYVAEEFDDPSTYGGVGIPWTASFVYSTATGLFSGQGGPVSGTVTVSSITNPITVASITDEVVVGSSGNSVVQGTASVVSGTPLNVTSKISGGSGLPIAVIISVASSTAAAILHISIGGSGNPGYYLTAPVAGGTSIQLVPPPNPDIIQYWLEASTGTISVELTAIYQ